MKKNRIAAMSMVLVMLFGTEALAFGSNVDVSPKQSSYERERSGEEWARLRDNKIEWDELRDLVHEYNPKISGLWISFRENDRDGLYNIDIDEALEAVEDSYNAASGAAQTDLEQAMANLSYQTNSARSSLDSTAQSSDREAVKLQIQQSESVATETIRRSIISIYSQRENQRLSALNAEHNRTLYEAALRRQSVGQGTAMDSLSAKESWEQSELSLKSGDAELEKLEQLLRVNLGWSYDSSPELCEVPIPSEEELKALDLARDTETALEKNYAILINERKRAVSGTDAQIQQLSISIENQKENVRADMLSRHRALAQAGSELAQAGLARENAESSLEKTRRSHQAGSASSRALESAQLELEKAVASERLAGYSLAGSYYDYLAGRDGIANASAG